jgi:pyruvate ferredoxin oxidoreductase gamma subunit
MLEIRWHGRGGQGAITVSRVLAMAALQKGLFVQSFPEYGPERGGAPMKAYNRISDSEIKLHCGIYEPDLVAVLDQTLLEAEDVTEGLRASGGLVVNTPRSPQEIRLATGFSGGILTLDAEAIARESNKFPNVPLLGALIGLIETVSLTEVADALRELLSGKLSEEKVQLNVEALKRGFAEAQVSRESHGSGRSGIIPKRHGPHLKSYQKLPIGGVITGEVREAHQTGGWRQQKPVFDEARCVNCLLCWVNCPEPAILIEGQKMVGYDYRYCKGCAICFASCPSGAISMVAEAEIVPPQGRINSIETREAQSPVSAHTRSQS